MRIGDQLRARLVDTDPFDLLGNAQPLEQWQIKRQQRFPDVKTREALLLQNDDVPFLLREKRRDGGSGGAASDDKHIAF